MRDIRLRQSDIRTFLECKRKFYLEVVRGLVPARERDPLMAVPYGTNHLGNLIHEGMSRYYTGRYDNMTREQVFEDVLSFSQEYVDEKAYGVDETGVAVSPSPEWVNALETAPIVVADYIPWVEAEKHDVGYRTVAVEERMVHTVNQVTVTGQPDLVMYDELTNEYGILDHKSVGPLSPVRPGDFQLLTYAWLYWKTTGNVTSWAAHNQLKRNKHTARAKPPFYDRKPISISLDALERHDELMCSLTSDIQRYYDDVLSHGDDPPVGLVPPSMTGECPWKCRVNSLCDYMHETGVWVSIADTTYTRREEV